jgi:hypothetical protein
MGDCGCARKLRGSAAWSRSRRDLSVMRSSPLQRNSRPSRWSTHRRRRVRLIATPGGLFLHLGVQAAGGPDHLAPRPLRRAVPLTGPAPLQGRRTAQAGPVGADLGPPARRGPHRHPPGHPGPAEGQERRLPQDLVLAAPRQARRPQHALGPPVAQRHRPGLRPESRRRVRRLPDHPAGKAGLGIFVFSVPTAVFRYPSFTSWSMAPAELALPIIIISISKLPHCASATYPLLNQSGMDACVPRY